jgi:hypothetical protein
MPWRILGLFLNPVAVLVWPVLRWIGRGIDRLLGPKIGWYLALMIVLLTGAGFLAGIHSSIPAAGRLFGLIDPIAVEIVSGRILAVEVLQDGALTIKERITVAVQVDSAPATFEEEVTVPSTRSHQAGGAVTVYLRQGQEPTTRDPNDAVRDAVTAVFGIGFPLICLLLALWFLRHRKLVRDAYVPPVPGAPLSSLRLGRGDRVMTTAERLKVDEESVRQRAGKRIQG